MKEKVVLFTENNARILVNPPDVKAFENKPNAYVNPDLNFVKGEDPHFWKNLTDKISLADAHRLKALIAENIDWTSDEPIHQQVFYKELYHKLEEEIAIVEKSTTLIAKLLEKSEGIKREDITSHLADKLIKPTKNASQIKENKSYDGLIKTWSMGSIVPMDEDEKELRAKHIKKYGIINTETEPKIKWKLMSLSNTILFLAMTLILLLIVIKNK